MFIEVFPLDFSLDLEKNQQDLYKSLSLRSLIL